MLRMMLFANQNGRHKNLDTNTCVCTNKEEKDLFDEEFAFVRTYMLSGDFFMPNQCARVRSMI